MVGVIGYYSLVGGCMLLFSWWRDLMVAIVGHCWLVERFNGWGCRLLFS